MPSLTPPRHIPTLRILAVASQSVKGENREALEPSRHARGSSLSRAVLALVRRSAHASGGLPQKKNRHTAVSHNKITLFKDQATRGLVCRFSPFDSRQNRDQRIRAASSPKLKALELQPQPQPRCQIQTNFGSN
jgi:hypothetical protein